MHTRRIRRPFIVMVALSVLFSGFFAASLNRAWAAPDPGMTAIKNFLSADPAGNLATWSGTLDEQGAFGEPVPLVAASPGALVGADTLIQQAVAVPLAGVTNYVDLSGKDFAFNAGDGRTGTLHTEATQVGDGWRVDFTANLTRTVAGLDLRLSHADPAVELTVTGGVTAEVTSGLTFSIQEDGAGAVWLVHGTATPRLDVDVKATLDADANAAVGILGVVVTSSTLTINHHTVATFDDPNSDGRLAFTENGASGELAADGALEGLVNVTADPQGSLPISNAHSGTPGSVQGTLNLGAAPAGGVPGLATSVNASLVLSWPNTTQGALTLTVEGFDASLAKFQNLTLQSLADGLARVITAVGAMQQRSFEAGGVPTGNLDLPFMRGTLADAIEIAAPLKAFLEANIWTGDGVDPARLGTPKFSSLQDLLSRLDDSLDLGTVEWDSAANKFVIPLGFSAKATASEPLDKTPDGAGSASDPSSASAEVGAIVFADSLQVGGSGIAGANAETSLALVTPSHEANLTIVLDLRDPVTGNDCLAAVGKPCPYNQTVAGMNLTVDEWPLPTDRVMLRTGSTIYSANFPVTSAIDFDARAGFFELELKGSLVMCSSGQGADCSGTPPAAKPMVSMALKEMGDAQHDLRLSELVDTIVSAPADLLDPKINIRARAAAKITVPGLDGFLPADAMEFSVAWADISDPTGVSLDSSKLAKLASLDFDPANPQALFGILLSQLRSLVAGIAEANPSTGGSAFTTEIPGLGRSLRDLMLTDQANGGDGVTFGASTLTDATRTGDDTFGSDLVGRAITVGTAVNIVASVSTDGKTLTMAEPWDSVPAGGSRYLMRAALLDALDWLVTENPDSIQKLIASLNERLDGTGLTARYLDGAQPSIVLDVAWDRSYRADTPLNVDISGVGDLVSMTASGQAQARVSSVVDVGLVIPLSATGAASGPSQLKVMQDSSISVHAAAEASKGVITGSLGGLSLSVGDPADGGEKAVVKANLGVGIGVPGGTKTPVTWPDFLGAVAVQLNPTGGPGASVSCETSLTAELMACAHLPLFAKGVGATYTSIGAVDVRLPRSQNAADLVPTGNLPAPNASVKRLDYPSDLASRIAAAVLDFSSFEHGIDGYLAVAEAGLRTASFDGKIPLVGKDLQQGADFLGELRTTLKTKVLGGLASASPRQWVDTVNQRLTAELDKIGLTAIDPLVAIECSALLEPAGAPTLTAAPVPEDGAVEYAYRIVATQPGSETLPGAPATVQQKPLSAENTVKVDWGAVNGATGYKVLRKAPGETAFRLVATVTGLTFTDTGAAASDYTAAQHKPQLVSCPGEAVTGASLAVTVKDSASVATRPLDLGLPGLSLKADPNSDHSTIEASFGYELHIKAGLNRSDGFFVATQDGWGDDNRAHPELGVNLSVKMPTDLEAKVAFIGVDIESNTTKPLFEGEFQIDLRAPGVSQSCFLGTEAICAPNPDAKLRLADLSSAGQVFATSLTGGVLVDWKIASRIETGGDENLMPGIEVDFKMAWSFDNNAATSMGLPSIEFNNFRINAGDVFSDILRPILEKVKAITGPIQPIIDAIYAPLPVLSEVSRAAGGGDISLFTLASTFSTLAGGPKLEMVQRLADVVTLLNSMPECDGDTCMVTIGSFKVKPAEALSTSLTPDVAASLVTAEAPNLSLLEDLNEKAEGDTDATFDPQGGEGGMADKAGIKFPIFQEPTKAFALLMGGDVDLVTFNSGPLSLGFSFSQEFGPVYAPPPVLITLSGSASITAQIRAGMDTYGIRKAIENKDAGLRAQAVSLLDGLYFATTDEQGRPAPVLTLKGEIAAGAMVSVLIASVGIEGGLGLTIGMFWNDPNNDGKFRVSEFLNAALNNPICLFVASGRVYLFLRLNLKIGFSIFSVKFSVTLVDLTLVDFTLAADCEPPPPDLGGVVGDTLYIFAGKLGTNHYRGGDWGSKADSTEAIKVTQLHYAQTAANPDGTDAAYDGIKVQMLGLTREFHDPGIKRVVVDGTDGLAALDLSFSGDGQRVTDPGAPAQTVPFDRAVFVKGTSHADKITTGTGPARVDGGAGNDVIVTSDTGLDVAGIGRSDAWVAGGPGDDRIVVGDGDNRVSGDASLGFAKNAASLTLTKAVDAKDAPKPIPAGTVLDPNSAKDPLNQPEGTVGDDSIRVGLGATVARGNGGDDTLSVTTDTATTKSKGVAFLGDLGTDRINGGAGYDLIVTGAVAGSDVHVAVEALRTGTIDVDGDGHTEQSGKFNVVNSGSGNDLVIGSTAMDLLMSGSLVGQSTQLVGGAHNDVLVGGYGADKLYGGPGQDTLVAEPANVGDEAGTHMVGDVDHGVYRTVERIPLPAGQASSPKTLVGGFGSDHIYGGDGNALIYGDRFIAGEQCRAGVPLASDPVGESTPLDDGNDFIVGGFGVDTVSAGGGSDRVHAGGGDDLVCGQMGDDKLDGQGGTDRLWGGTGLDTIWGGSGDDFLYGNDGNDVLYGGGDTDTIEGNAGDDWASGGVGDDLVIGGTSAPGKGDGADELFGDSGRDLMAGDNATLTVVPLAQTDQLARNRITSQGRAIVMHDLGDSPPADVSGADRIHGGADADLIFGQGGPDRLFGNAGDDLIEGGSGSDWIEGNAGDDDLVGGSSWAHSGTDAATVGQPDKADAVFGGAGDDVLLGDNGRVARPSAGEPGVAALRRAATNGDVVTARRIDWFDLAAGGAATRYGNDRLSGGDGVDAIWGQDGDDLISGDGGGDYIEGNGGADLIRGDLPLTAASTVTTDAAPMADPGWPGAPSPSHLLFGPGSTDGQDDIIGGSARVGFRDAGDRIEGNGGDDVVLGDNGTLLRVLAGMPGSHRDAVHTERYPIGAVPSDATRVRVADQAVARTTRFCVSTGTTCEPAGAFGNDVIHGDDGDDGLWGQDGNDLIRGGNGNDELYGELGDDRLFGDAGDDAILGDRGGVATTFLDGDRGPAETTYTLTQPPNESYTAFRRGTLDRRVDLMHDTDGGVFLDIGTRGVMPHPGTTIGGRDQVRGGLGRDVIFTGFGDDLANGDSGGDVVFGGDGEDVLWGGRGCDPVADALTADCLVGGVFDPSARGDNDRFVDLVFGGAGELTAANQNVLGADILDWAPRGGFENCTTADWPETIGTQTYDPCLWFEMTDTHDADVANNQHNHGVDWIYGGLDRDVLQGNLTPNGPNNGDRLLDTTGAYNLYSHCDSAYGGSNDIRVMSPAVRNFLFLVAYGAGAGQTSLDVTTKGTAAYVDLAMVYNSDMKRAAGPAFPGTPGHFDQGACQP